MAKVNEYSRSMAKTCNPLFAPAKVLICPKGIDVQVFVQEHASEVEQPE